MRAGTPAPPRPIWPDDPVALDASDLLGVIDPLEDRPTQLVTGTVTHAIGRCGERVVILDAPLASGACVLLVASGDLLPVEAAESASVRNAEGRRRESGAGDAS